MYTSLNSFKLCILVFLLWSCGEKTNQPVKGKIRWLATTGMIGDALKQLADSTIEVEILMGPGVDPHLYKATQGDLLRLRSADLIVYNGHHLEGKLSEILSKLSDQKKTIALAELLPDQDLIEADGAVDPHIWFDVSLWSKSLDLLTDSLIKIYPDLSTGLSKRNRDYSTRLDSLHEGCKSAIRLIPEQQRVLVTAHDAFSYWGRAYGLEVMGLQGISTLSDFGLKDLNDLVDILVSRKIPAVFVESSVPTRSIEAVINGCETRGHQIKLGGELYSDAMGNPGTESGTYIGMVSHNLQTIVNALQPAKP